MLKAALYIRVSTHFQIDRDSLPVQKADLENLCKYVLGIDDFVIFEDAGYSAKNTDRPDYQDMMSRIRKGEFTHLLVWKIDRISRNLLDFSEMWKELQSCNITFISKNEQFDTSTPIGKAMLRIIMIFAELERDMTVERVTSIMLARAEKGLWNGANVPLGYKWDDEIKFPVIDEDEAKVVHYIYDLYETHRSTNKVTRILNSENIPTKRGGTWTSKTVCDILKSPFYIGTYRYNVKDQRRRWKKEKEWVIIPDNHPAIIDKEQFDRVQMQLSDNYKGDKNYQREVCHTHIFHKLLTCENCGCGFVASQDRPRDNGYKPSRYICKNQRYGISICKNSVGDVYLLPFVFRYVVNFIQLQEKFNTKMSPAEIEKILLSGEEFSGILGITSESLSATHTLLLSKYAPIYYDTSADDAPDVLSLEAESLKKEKAKFERALIRLDDLYLYSESDMSQKDYFSKKRGIEDKITDVNSRIRELYAQFQNSDALQDDSFIQKAQLFLLNKHLNNGGNSDAFSLVSNIGTDLLADIMSTVLTTVHIREKKITGIEFANGLKHNFVYK